MEPIPRTWLPALRDGTRLQEVLTSYVLTGVRELLADLAHPHTRLIVRVIDAMDVWDTPPHDEDTDKFLDIVVDAGLEIKSYLEAHDRFIRVTRQTYVLISLWCIPQDIENPDLDTVYYIPLYWDDGGEQWRPWDETWPLAKAELDPHAPTTIVALKVVLDKGDNMNLLSDVPELAAVLALLGQTA